MAELPDRSATPSGASLPVIVRAGDEGQVLPERTSSPDRGAFESRLRFFETARSIFATRNPERLPEVIVQAAIEVMDSDAVTLLLPAGDGTLRVAHAVGMPPDLQKSTRIKIGEGIAGRVAEDQIPIVLNGPVADGHGRTPSSIVYPLASAGRLAGVLTFNRTKGQPAFTEADLEATSVLASQVLLALENCRLIRQTALSEKLAAVGQLAAGIAHEINTPVQFIGDSVHFMRGAMEDLRRLLDHYRALCQTAASGELLSPMLLAQTAALEQEIEVDFLSEEVPRAIERSLEGVRRVAEIVQAVKSFGRADQREKVRADLNQLIRTTVVVARPEYRQVAELELDLGDLPAVACHPGELNQVFLNLVVNAGHAIADVNRISGAHGLISVRTSVDGEHVLVCIADSGGGIPEAVRDRIFDPFFTTKEVGRGTGLGLAIARTIVVEKHAGTLSFETESGRGTTFSIRLPIEPPAEEN